VEARAVLAADPETNAYRLVHAEADLLPGLVVDRYADAIVVQFLTAGVERVRDIILDALGGVTGVDTIIERSDASSRTKEGLGATSGTLRGGKPEGMEILENGRRFGVDLTGGQKTGFYLDQRGNRRHVCVFAAGRTVLDAFSYTGAFSVNAMSAGAASVTLVDSSEAALQLAEKNISRNEIDEKNVELVQADVFELLREYRNKGRRFGMVVLDPPKFAVNKRQVDKALRGYKDINMLAMGLLEPGGILASFSCSGAVGADEFTRAVSWAGIDADREVQILRRLSQGSDHPVLASFPESEYLKGLICRIV
jgi:23S rRNA (cytosine1962-C5)-methyltransferase